MIQSLVIVGAGGFGRETAAAVQAVNAQLPTWELLGFADDQIALRGREIDGLKVLGSAEEVLASRPDAQVVVSTGNPSNYFTRARVVSRLGMPRSRYATIVHPGASVAGGASIGAGTVLLAGVVVTAAASIGDHVAVMPQCVITHDNVVGDYVTIAAGVLLGGSVTVERGAYLGAGAKVRQDLTIGAWSLLGMGSVLTRALPSAQEWWGAPARHRRDVEVPPDVAG